MKQREIHIGDTIAVIDDTVKGVVIDIQNITVTILDTEGFERKYKLDEIVVYDTLLASDTKKIKKETANNTLKKKERTSKNVIDLHYKKSNTHKTILENQLSTFQYHLNRAIATNQSNITFIHGVGEGILRKEIERILRKKGLVFSDAPYHKYGYGALEVYLK